MELRPGYKMTEVGVIPEDWGLRPFSELFDFQNGVNAEKAAYAGGLPFINVLEPITYSHLYGPEIPGRVSLPGSLITSYIVLHGDVVFNRTSETQQEIGLAATYLGEERVVFGGFVIRGRPVDQSFDPEYAGYALRAPVIRSQIIPMGQGAIRANIGQQSLSLVLAPIPAIAEQIAIAEALSDITQLLESLERLIAKKRDLKQAAIQQLLTGRTRLPGFQCQWEVGSIRDVLTRLQAKSNQIETSAYQSSGRYPVVDQGKEMVVGYSDDQDKKFPCSPEGVIVFGDHTCIVKFIDFDFVIGADGTQILCAKPSQNTRFHAYQLQYRGVNPTGYNRHFKHLEERVFSIPPFDEQTAIATILSDMDAELAALEQRLAKTRALKQGMMQELLTGRIRLVVPKPAQPELAHA